MPDPSTPLPPPPEKPDPRECCGRHCDPCIFDYYDRALETWRERSGRALAADPGQGMPEDQVRARPAGRVHAKRSTPG